MSNRLARYRALNDRLRLTSPISALEKGLYVKRPGLSAADEIVGHMEPSPTSAIALVGGIGSGKSTELLLAEKRLSEVEDTRAFYIDVSELHDLDKLEHGVLVAAVGLKLCELLEETLTPRPPRDVSHSIAQFRSWAATDIDLDTNEDSNPPDEFVLTPGKLSMPQKVAPDVQYAFHGLFTKLLQSLPSPHPYLIVLLDSLDRISNMEAFGALIEADLRLLQKAGIGVVLTAPLLSLYGQYRPLLDRFDHIVAVRPLDVETDPQAVEFLAQVLAARDPEGLLTPPIRRLLAESSGGVLRDMLVLCTDAARSAYMAGADHIDEAHVRAAAFQLGRTRWLGLSHRDIDILRRLAKPPLISRSLVEPGRLGPSLYAPSTDDELALLMTRRILEYAQDGQPPRFVVHPVLRPLLQ